MWDERRTSGKAVKRLIREVQSRDEKVMGFG